MKRRTFISLAGFTTALWLPSIAKTDQKPITGKVTSTSPDINSLIETSEPWVVSDEGTVIKVIGIGGMGSQAIEYMIGQEICGVEFVVADTDARALKYSSAVTLIQLGQTGLSTHAELATGFKAAMETRQKIAECLKGAHMVFIVAGMGGGAGTGAAFVFAEVARELGILTVGLATLPFGFEGKRLKNASARIVKLQPYFDSLILIPNDRLLDVLSRDALMDETFSALYGILHKAVLGIVDMIQIPGLIGLDFEEVRTVLGERGLGMMGIATATGVNRARVAAHKVIESPLLAGVDLASSEGVLVAIRASPSLRMKEVSEVLSIVREAIPEDADVCFGASYNENMADDLRIVLISTGYVGQKNLPQL